MFQPCIFLNTFKINRLIISHSSIDTNILVIIIYKKNYTFYYTSLLFPIFIYIIYIFHCLVLVLFHHKLQVNFIYKLLFVLLLIKML